MLAIVISIVMVGVFYDVPHISETRNSIKYSVLYRPLLQAIHCPKKTLRPSPRGHKMAGRRLLKQRLERDLQHCPWRKSIEHMDRCQHVYWLHYSISCLFIIILQYYEYFLLCSATSQSVDASCFHCFFFEKLPVA